MSRPAAVERILFAQSLLLKHAGPDGSEVHSTGTYQSAHGGTAYHGTTSHAIADLLKEGFELGGRGRGSVWGKGVYLAPSLEAANFWARQSTSGDPVVVEIKLPKSLKVLTLRSGEDLFSMLTNIADEHEGASYARVYEERNPEVGRLLRDFVASRVSGEPRYKSVDHWPQFVLAHGYDALEILPASNDAAVGGGEFFYTGGHQLVIYNPDIFSSLKIKVVKGASQETWYLVLPRSALTKLTKHYGPGPHPGTGSDQSAHAGTSTVGGLLDTPLRFAEGRTEEDGKTWYSLPPRGQRTVNATFDSPEHALTSYREMIAYRQDLISQYPMPSDFGGRTDMQNPHASAYDMAFSVDGVVNKEALVAYRSAKERWTTEMMGTDDYLRVAAREALPAVIRRGEDLGERIDSALDRNAQNPMIPNQPMEEDSRLTALYEKSRLARNEAQRIYDEVYAQSRQIDRDSYPDQKPVFLVPKEQVTRQVDARGKRQWERGGEMGGWGMTWEEYNTQYGKLTMKPDAFAGGIHSYDLAPHEGAAYREYVEGLRNANPGLEIITSYDYTNLAATAYRSRSASADRYYHQRNALEEELRAARKFEGSNTEIIRDILKTEVPLGGTLNTFNTKSKGARAVASNTELIPTKWIEASNTAGPLYVETLQSRAHYVNSSSLPRNNGVYGATLRISGRFDNDDILHEFGHRVEATNPDVLFLERAFYESRTVGQDPVRLSSVLHSGYGPREMTIPDSFGHAYMGKRYREESDWGFRGTGTSSDRGWRYATDEAYELLSMGLPRIYEKSTDTIDSESRAFILGLILEAGE